MNVSKVWSLDLFVIPTFGLPCEIDTATRNDSGLLVEGSVESNGVVSEILNKRSTLFLEHELNKFESILKINRDSLKGATLYLDLNLIRLKSNI